MRITKIERADPESGYNIEARTQNGRVWRLFAFRPEYRGRNVRGASMSRRTAGYCGRVEHVYVNEGGLAVIGNVKAPD